MTDEQLKLCFITLGRLAVTAPHVVTGLLDPRKQHQMDELFKAYEKRIDNILTPKLTMTEGD